MANAPLAGNTERKKIPGTYVHYGCGSFAPKEWINFDVSPSLRIGRIPIVGKLLKSRIGTVWADNVKYGNIIDGLPGIKENSCDGVYCSHVLEHLSLDDFRTALKNTYKILKTGGIFRCVVPDLEIAARDYIRALEEGQADASIRFVGVYTQLGQEYRPKKITDLLKVALGNSHHRWMWDRSSLAMELKKAGFKNIRPCTFNDSSNTMFDLVENKERFIEAVAFECMK